MKTRTVTLVIFLLVFASATSAASTEGTEYQDSIVDDLGVFATELWNYAGPPLEPYVNFLYETALNDHSFDGIDGMSPKLPSASVETPQDVSLTRQDILFQPPTSSHSSLGWPSSGGINQEPHVHPQTPENQFDETSMDGLTAENMPPFDAQLDALCDDVMQTWLKNSYTTGHRVHLTTTFPASYQETPVFPQNPHLPTTQPSAAEGVLLQPEEGTLGIEHLRPRKGSQTSSSSLKCDGCDRICRTSEALRHHRRSHIPMHRRRYPCPINDCHLRFHCPREVTRHLPTHGLERPFHCHVPSCPWATKGFARQDHLTRHIRTKHAADSETGSSLGASSSV